eukprot:scaffold142013_cov31-Tisochrysis_lutea.AAC.8
MEESSGGGSSPRRSFRALFPNRKPRPRLNQFHRKEACWDSGRWCSSIWHRELKKDVYAATASASLWMVPR